MEQQTMPVEVSEVAIDSVTIYKDYPATLTADKAVDIVARVNGYVSGALYNGGDYVSPGQVLFTIRNEQYTNAVTNAQANLETAKSENEYAEQHYTAVQKAHQSNAVSDMELAQALSSRDQSRAAIESAKAALDDARQNLGYCTLRAPFGGHMSTNVYAEGSYVSGAAAPVTLATIYDDSHMIVNFAIEDASFMRMFENPNNRHLINYAEIPIEFQEKLPHNYTADLSYLAPNIDASTGTMVIQGKIKNEHNELRAGMYCTVRMPYKVDPQAVLVRDASISTDQLGKYVYVVNDSNKVVYTPIKVGDLVNDSMRVVSSGLEKGQRYVTAAMLKVRDGMTVKPFSK